MAALDVVDGDVQEIKAEFSEHGLSPGDSEWLDYLVEVFLLRALSPMIGRCGRGHPGDKGGVSEHGLSPVDSE